MDISLISIGNSKGIRLSKTVLEKYHIQDTMELILEKDYMILKPKSSARKGWDKAFKKMHENGDDKSLLSDVFKEETFEEWK
jgi:antitoxin MazE